MVETPARRRGRWVYRNRKPQVEKEKKHLSDRFCPEERPNSWKDQPASQQTYRRRLFSRVWPVHSMIRHGLEEYPPHSPSLLWPNKNVNLSISEQKASPDSTEVVSLQIPPKKPWCYRKQEALVQRWIHVSLMSGEKQQGLTCPYLIDPHSPTLLHHSHRITCREGSDDPPCPDGGCVWLDLQTRPHLSASNLKKMKSSPESSTAQSLVTRKGVWQLAPIARSLFRQHHRPLPFVPSLGAGWISGWTGIHRSRVSRKKRISSWRHIGTTRTVSAWDRGSRIAPHHTPKTPAFPACRLVLGLGRVERTCAHGESCAWSGLQSTAVERTCLNPRVTEALASPNATWFHVSYTVRATKLRNDQEEDFKSWSWPLTVTNTTRQFLKQEGSQICPGKKCQLLKIP